MKLILIVLFVVSIIFSVYVVSNAFADNFTEIQHTVGCNDYRTVIGNLMIDYDEKLIWEGQQENDVYTSLFVNNTTGSWTMLKYDDKKIMACVISEGIGYNIP